MIKDMVVTVADGRLELPKEVQETMNLTNGAMLTLRCTSATELRLEREAAPEVAPGEKQPIWLGNRWWIPNDDWRSLQGILDGHPEHDTSKVRHEERVWEAEHDARKFGPFPKP